MIVDDDPLFTESVSRNLMDAGFAVESHADGETALEVLRDGSRPDLLLLDWKMPGISGIEVLNRLRDLDIDIPVIFFTVLSDQVYEEAALGGGAVDFVEKSRSFAILLNRINLILSGAKGRTGLGEQEDADTLQVGNAELDLASSRAYWNGERVDLTLTEFEIVRHLISRAGQDVRYRELYDLVHGEDFAAGQGPEGYRANIRAIIKRIRQKFREVDDGFAQIENYPGFGYRWTADAADGR